MTSAPFIQKIVPKERSLQLFAATTATFLLISPVLSYLLLFWILYCSSYWYLAVIYCLWAYHDRRVAHTGGRKIRTIQKLTFWKHASNYFPMQLVKTVDLPTDKNYLFCVYPHGVLSISSFITFCTEACDFEKIFPKIDRYRITLDSNFYAPFSREFYLSTGNCASSEESIITILKKPESTACILVVGGASESLNAFPGSYRITLNRRKGFIRLALQTGASIVPVLSFGENDLYNQIRGGPILRKLQDMIRNYTGISPVLVLGRGIFQCTFGLLPFRHSVTTVVGKPIDVPKVMDPSSELIEEYKVKFIRELRSLFEVNKVKYDSNGANAKLVIE